MSAIPVGYKQTEVGVIPEDWDVRAIGDDIDLLTGFPFPSSGYSSSGIRLLRGSVTVQVPKPGYARRGIGGLPWNVITRA